MRCDHKGFVLTESQLHARRSGEEIAIQSKIADLLSSNNPFEPPMTSGIQDRRRARALCLWFASGIASLCLVAVIGTERNFERCSTAPFGGLQKRAQQVQVRQSRSPTQVPAEMSYRNSDDAIACLPSSQLHDRSCSNRRQHCCHCCPSPFQPAICSCSHCIFCSLLTVLRRCSQVHAAAFAFLSDFDIILSFICCCHFVC